MCVLFAASHLNYNHNNNNNNNNNNQGESQDTQRKKILVDLETQLAQTENKTHYYEKKHKEVSSTVDALKTGISNIFFKTGCDKIQGAEVGVVVLVLVPVLVVFQ